MATPVSVSIKQPKTIFEFGLPSIIAYSQTGVSLKAGYRRSITACRTSYCHLFGFH